MLDVHAIRSQFPALTQNVNGEQLVYLDSAATTQKPDCVINAISDYYRSQNANVHRGSHSLTAQATSSFEAARQTIATFIGAESSNEIIWTRGATEALNLIAQTYARDTLQPDDEILVSEMEHHANIVPWQIVAEQTGARVIKVPMTEDCQWDMAAFSSLLSDKTKLVALAHITNVTGTRLPIESVITQAHQVGAKVVVDGAQGIVHETIDVKTLDADFYVFSGHKLYAPAGIGVLYGKLSLLDAMPPWHGGGKMVEKVSFSGTTFSELPGKFEAGTPNVAGAIALATAINWYQSFEHTDIENHIRSLVQNAYQRLSQIDDIRVLGYQANASVLSFVIDGVHHQDLATLLDQQGIAVRAGHHCAHPLMDALGVKGTVRASFAIYNTQQDVDKLVAAVEKAADML
ncbi:cysteine desulfurase CsdA [Vibrio coralliilyticus]|uniref:cysteine desulfurase CsdA n=1 Tax=Vibrio coralliilyticus TaxID=190893 RepID=UPI0015616384|nr:cysteine desulfurase CsdA [Vibrio coralliilyticus]NRF29435.1 cysteine desulfurase CsdA [Vibrio coralliilyticus]NRF52349.1 cysteine desulfurase CsdA [Vibrio coralliilyticus]NRG03070.1 cysteine desulfurase CsdA [Vibrio coralliilyticus]